MSNLNKFQYLELYNNEKYSLKYPNVTYVWDIGKCIFNGRDKAKDGSPDIAGLIKIGWDLKDIDELFYGLGWFASENDENLVPQSDIDLIPMTIDKITLSKATLKFCPKFNTSDITDMSHMFEQCKNLTGIPILDTSKVTDMSYMFSECYKVTGYFNYEGLSYIPKLNTSNVINMEGMFKLCRNLFNKNGLKLELNTSKVTNMSHMFEGCERLSLVPQLNTSNVTNMSNMFAQCMFLTKVPEFDTSNVVNMSGMFRNCNQYLKELPCFNISKVTDMSNMFYGCSNLSTIEFSGGQPKRCNVQYFLLAPSSGKGTLYLHLPGNYDPIMKYCKLNGAFESWDIIYLGNVHIKCKVFKDGDWLTGELNLTINKNKLKYNSLDGMYEYAVCITKDNWLYLDKSIFLDGVKIGELDFSKSINVIGRKGDGNLDKEGLKAIGWTDDDIKYLNTYVYWDLAQDNDYIVPQEDIDLLPMDSSKVTSVTMYCPMFDTSQITDMSGMFASSGGIIPKLNTSNVTNMSGMFNNYYGKIIPEFDTSNVTNMSNMFAGTYDYYEPDMELIIPEFDTSKVTDMSGMFRLAHIKINPKINTSKVLNMMGMFSNCLKLTTITKLNVSSAIDLRVMFANSSVDNIELEGGVKLNCNCQGMFNNVNYTGTLYLDSKKNNWAEVLALVPSSWTVVYRDEQTA